jgi:hypothetical protein
MQQGLDAHARAIHLKPQCETRWSCRASSIEAVFLTFPAIVKTLKWAANDRSVRTTEARGLLIQILEFPFILNLHIMRKVFSTTLSLSNLLQKRNFYLAKACLLVDTTIQPLESFKDEKIIEDLYSNAKQFADANVVLKKYTLEFRPKRIRQMPQCLEESILCETVGSYNNNEVEVRREYKEVIHKVLQEMRRRFEVTNKSIMTAIQALLPTSTNFFVARDIQPLTAHYHIDQNQKCTCKTS